nr:uncharacterized protein LOC126516659 [Dermacentor andersoni]
MAQAVGHDHEEAFSFQAATLMKRLKRVLGKVENQAEQTAGAVVACPKVDIGHGVSVEQGTLDKLCRACESGPGKFARALLRNVFTPEELRGKTLLGGKSNLHLNQPLKEALDPVRVQAVIDYTCSKFPSASLGYIKNSLSSMLARELKEPEVQ